MAQCSKWVPFMKFYECVFVRRQSNSFIYFSIKSCKKVIFSKLNIIFLVLDFKTMNQIIEA